MKVNFLIDVASRLVRFAGWRQPFFLANRSSKSHRVQPKVNTAKNVSVILSVHCFLLSSYILKFFVL